MTGASTESANLNSPHPVESPPAVSARPKLGATGMLVRSSAHAFAASLFGVLIGLATSIVVARALGPREKGAYDLVFSTAILLALVLGLSTPGGITFAVARKASAARSLVAWILALGVAQVVAAFVVLSVLSGTDLSGSLGLGTVDTPFRVALSLLTAVFCVTPCLRAILVGGQRVVLASWLDVLGRAITLLILLGAALFTLGHKASAERFIVAILVGGVLGAVLFLPGALRSTTGAVGAGLRTVIRFAAPSYGANVLQFLNYRVDLFLVAYFRDLREVGLYALAASLVQLVWLVANSVATSVFARIGSNVDRPAEAASRTAALSRSVLVIQFALAASLAVLARPLLAILYGTAFEPAASAIWLLLPGVTVFGVATVLAAHLAGEGRPHLNLIVSAASLVVTLALDLLLIPSFGMNGAAIASSASYAATAGLTALLFSSSTGVPLGRILIPRRADVSRLTSMLTRGPR